MRYCPSCGSLLDGGVETCPSCGSRATTVDARPEPEEARPEKTPAAEEPPRWSPKLVRRLVIAGACGVVLLAVLILWRTHRQRLEEIQATSRPVLALLRSNQARCAKLDREIRNLAGSATDASRADPIGDYLLGEGSLELAEIEASLGLLGEISTTFEDEEAPFTALRRLFEAHRAFCRLQIEQPDGEPATYAQRSDALLRKVGEASEQAAAAVPLGRRQEEDLLYPYRDRIAEARQRALTFLLEEEKRKADEAFARIEAADESDMEARIRAVEEYERIRSGVEVLDERIRSRQQASRQAAPLVERPTAAPLPSADEVTPDQRRLAAEARLWRPKVEEGTREVREIATRLRQLIVDNTYPPDMQGECRRLLEAAEELPEERFSPAPEAFLEQATQKAVAAWRTAAEQCLEESFFALDSNLHTAETSWRQVQDRIEELSLLP